MKALLFAILMISSMTAKADVAYFLGLNYQDVTTDINMEVDPTVGYKAGVLATIDINEKFAIRYGVGFSVREFSASANGVENDYKLHYVDIPLAVQYKINNMFAVYAGPQFAIRMRHDFDVGGPNLNPEDSKYLYTMYQAGVSYRYSEIGIDLYYESGFNSFMLRVPQTNYSTIGINFVEWF